MIHLLPTVWKPENSGIEIVVILDIQLLFSPPGWGGDTPYNGLYGKALPQSGSLFTLELYEWVGISRVES